jgi:bifunctional DNase/RNase
VVWLLKGKGVEAMVNEAAVEMFVGGLVMDPTTQAPIVVLKDESGSVTLPIWIGLTEATSIASAIKQIAMARPLTHDLFYDLLQELSITVQRIVITELRESTYFAELILGQGDRVLVLDARPSDAIAMALRASAPIYVAQQVLDQARIAFASQGTGSAQPSPQSQEGQPAPDESGEGEVEDESSKDFQAVDKAKWEEILQQLDPDDFKYKM